MGFKRPEVRIFSLGPRKGLILKEIKPFSSLFRQIQKTKSTRKYPFDWSLTGVKKNSFLFFDWSFSASFSECGAKCLVESLDCLLLDRGLHMQIVLRHVQIRVAHHALDRRQVHAQRLHLTDIGVPARMRRQLPYSFNGGSHTA